MKLTYLIPLAVASLLTSACQTTKPTALAGFTFDGCTCFPEGIIGQPDLWEEHCRKHDYLYWKGGTREERKAADRLLREGIRSEGKPLIAQVAYTGVRIGGTPWLPTSWRWGFGWKEYPRGYRELSEEEKRRIEKACPDPPACGSETKGNPGK